MERNKAPTLAEIAEQMKWECYETSFSKRTLSRGLQLTLTPVGHKWKLIISREDAMPTKKDYKSVCKAFFNRRVKHIRQPSENSVEITTAENWTE